MSDFETIRRPGPRADGAKRSPPGLLRFAPVGDPPRFEFVPLAAPMLGLGRAQDAGLQIEDEEVSRKHAFIAQLGGTTEIVDADSANGVVVDGRPVKRLILSGGEVIRLGSTFFLYLQEGLGAERAELTPSGPPFVGGPTMQEVLTRLDRAAESDLSVLILGETGTGKELAARRLHEAGGRASGPFVPVNCAAIPGELMESELFGHDKGAFTGADAPRTGLFREAQGGTLFLDEIGDLAAAAQAKLLRALETLRIRPVGGNREVDVDVRVVAATHRDLASEVESGRFRRDLHARLARLIVRLPPLRDRVEDVPLLAHHMLANAKTPRRLSSDAIERLCVARWPQNVRELQSALDRAAFLAPDAEVLEPEHFEDLVFDPEPAAPPRETPEASTPNPERDELASMLSEHRGDVEAAAEAMGISRSQLYRRAQKLGVRVSDFKR